MDALSIDLIRAASLVKAVWYMIVRDGVGRKDKGLVTVNLGWMREVIQNLIPT